MKRTLKRKEGVPLGPIPFQIPTNVNWCHSRPQKKKMTTEAAVNSLRNCNGPLCWHQYHWRVEPSSSSWMTRSFCAGPCWACSMKLWCDGVMCSFCELFWSKSVAHRHVPSTSVLYKNYEALKQLKHTENCVPNAGSGVNPESPRRFRT